MPRSADWAPTRIVEVFEAKHTASDALHVLTDAGEAFLKALGNRSGQHALACEWVGTQLAELFGLPTFDYGLIRLGEADRYPLASGGTSRPGSAFITRAEDGISWGGGARSLMRLVNPQDVPRLVVFDTWTRNCDRHSPGPPPRIHADNVFLSRERAPRRKFVLKATDHTHCFTCGRDLTPRLSAIETVRDPLVYGFFNPFRRLMKPVGIAQAARDLFGIGRSDVERIVASVPAEWEVGSAARSAWVDLVCERAKFVAETIVDAVAIRATEKT